MEEGAVPAATARAGHAITEHASAAQTTHRMGMKRVLTAAAAPAGRVLMDRDAALTVTARTVIATAIV